MATGQKSTGEGADSSVSTTARNMQYSRARILQSKLLHDTTQRVIGTVEVELVRRPGCLVIRAYREDPKEVHRLMILPPHGYTGNRPELLNSHPEVRKARVRILGKLNPQRKGYKPLVREVQFLYSLARHAPTESDNPYTAFSRPHCDIQLKSWRNWFYVVKESGWGFYHCLVNLTDEWVVAELEKHQLDIKQIRLTPVLRHLPSAQSETLRYYLHKASQLGDRFFDDSRMVDATLKFHPVVLTRALLQMLNTQETGKHEPCTFFGLLLKMAKKERAVVLRETRRAMRLQVAPDYYLNDLLNKLQ
jgi:hypothetical protein